MRAASASTPPRVDVQPVVSDGQVGGQLERGLTDRPAVEVVGRPVVLQLAQTRADRAVLESDPAADGLAVGDVHPEGRREPGPGDDGRRQGAAPVLAILGEQGGLPFVLGARRHAKRAEHRDQRRLRDRTMAAGPVVVLGGNPVTAGEFDERWGQFGHGGNLAGWGPGRPSPSRRAAQWAGPTSSIVSTPAMTNAMPMSIRTVSGSPNR